MRKNIFPLLSLLAILFPLFSFAAVPASVSRAVQQANDAATLDVACTINGRAASMTLSGECFYIDFGSAKVYFDGKTQWSYSPDDKEVTVMEPTADELAETNPLSVIRTLTKEFNGEAVKGRPNTVRLTPVSPRSQIAEATVVFSPSTGWPTEMTLITGSGRADFKNLRFTPSKTKKPAGAFQFQAPAGTTVTDLR